MQGKVEVYKNYGTSDQELVVQGHNLLMDGAGELFTEIMTTSPSVSAIRTASSILHTSNYTVQAISFGKGAFAYAQNAHDVVNDSIKQASALGASAVGYVSSTTTSSYIPPAVFPTAPNPIHSKLEHIPTDMLPNTPNITKFGQNINFFGVNGIPAAAVDKLVVFGNGCWPLASGTDIVLMMASGGGYVATSSVSGQFNEVSSMDKFGYVRRTATGDDASGLVVSSTVAEVSTTGEITYRVNIGKGDLAFANLYGGIYHVGLWSINMVSSLASFGAVPPFPFVWNDNKIKYRIFAKKTFLENIAKVQDSGDKPGINSYDNLTLIWKLRFL